MTSRRFRRSPVQNGVVPPKEYQCRRTWRSKMDYGKPSKPAGSLRRQAGFGCLPKPNNRQTERHAAKDFTQISRIAA